ncbi:hypothetical protein, partial [Streptomyces lavendulocolor]|uniref:hypothetical protein n=1 Tax=Streptomyces lavendulocolor TaxID=67316 RepID=UPI0031DA9E71
MDVRSRDSNVRAGDMDGRAARVRVATCGADNGIHGAWTMRKNGIHRYDSDPLELFEARAAAEPDAVSL